MPTPLQRRSDHQSSSSTFRTALPGALAKCGRTFGVIMGEINPARYLEATDHTGPRIISAINATTLPGFGDGRVHIAQWFVERCRISLNGVLSDKDRNQNARARPK